MIRINLLPTKQTARAQASQPSQAWLLGVLGVLALFTVGLFFFHQTKVDELDTLNTANDSVQARINANRALTADHEAIKKELAVLRARREAIAKLQAGRSGPTAVLLELAKLMTPGKGPSIDPAKLDLMRKENPLAVYNPSWDSRRLWLTSYVENQRVVRIEGLARDGSDVSELAQRLKLSPYFYDVKLLPGKKEASPSKGPVVSFALQLKVRY